MVPHIFPIWFAIGSPLFPHPFNKKTFPKLLKKLRNDGVTQLMREKQQAVDPTASDAGPLLRSREELFEGLPEIIDLNIPSVDSVGPHVMAVLTTPSLMAPVVMQLTCANIEFFSDALDVDWQEQLELGPAQGRSKRGLVSSEHHRCKIYKVTTHLPTSGDRITLSARVHQQAFPHKQKRFQKSWNLSEDIERNEKLEATTIEELEQAGVNFMDGNAAAPIANAEHANS